MFSYYPFTNISYSYYTSNLIRRRVLSTTKYIKLTRYAATVSLFKINDIYPISEIITPMRLISYLSTK